MTSTYYQYRICKETVAEGARNTKTTYYNIREVWVDEDGNPYTCVDCFAEGDSPRGILSWLCEYEMPTEEMAVARLKENYEQEMQAF